MDGIQGQAKEYRNLKSRLEIRHAERFDLLDSFTGPNRNQDHPTRCLERIRDSRQVIAGLQERIRNLEASIAHLRLALMTSRGGA